MGRGMIVSVAALVLLANGMAQANPCDRLRARLGNQSAGSAAPVAPGKQTLAYGPDALQVLDYWPAQGVKSRAPLVLFVHGGGWKRGSKDNASARYRQRSTPLRPKRPASC